MPSGGTKTIDDRPKDLFDQPIDVGDYVIGGQGHVLAIYRVIKITPKMVRVVNIANKKSSQGKLRYSNELAKIEEAQATFYVLKNVK